MWVIISIVVAIASGVSILFVPGSVFSSDAVFLMSIQIRMAIMIIMLLAVVYFVASLRDGWKGGVTVVGLLLLAGMSSAVFSYKVEQIMLPLMK